MIVTLMHKKYESFIKKIRKFRNSYFSNQLGVVKYSTKLYIFLIWQNIILFKIFLGKKFSK